MRITTTGLAVLALGMLSAPAAAQMPTLTVHGGLGLAVFKPGDYAIRDGQAVAWDSDRHASLAGGLSITLHRVETMFRFYPFGTFENQGHVTNEDAESETATRSPVRVMTHTVGYTFY